MRSIDARKLIAAIVGVVALGLGAAPVASAVTPTTYTVNTMADTGAANPASSCSDSSGQQSLRSVLECVNTAPPAGGAIIDVPSGTYTLTAAGGATQGTNGELTVTETSVPVTIVRTGTLPTVIDANYIDRAFGISSGVSVTISGLTVEHGRAGPNLSGDTATTCPVDPNQITQGAQGGAILDQGTLILTNDAFTNNMSSGRGGAVEDSGFGVGNGSLTVTGSTFTANTACNVWSAASGGFVTGINDGGGLDESSGGNVTIDSSVISDNVAQENGGGVAESFPGDPASVTITNSTISGNHADGDGGGIGGEGAGTISLFADTLNGNTATGNGGGIGGNDTEQVTNSTITGNFAGCPSTDPASCGTTGSGDGGGIANAGGTVTISFSTINDNNALGGSGGNLANDDSASYTLDDSIVTGGVADSSPENCSGFTATSNGHNLFDDQSCGVGGTDNVVANEAAVQLGSLKNNGGPTETEALGSGSPAIDHADRTLCDSETVNSSQQAVDQRGVTRPQPAGGQCDIGAYEAQKSGGGGGGGKTTLTISTTVFDAATQSAWAGTESAGASAYDTANLGGTTAGLPSGSVTYMLFDSGTCSGTAASTDTETLNSDGSVPSSKSTGPLAEGSYSYQASYSGDANYSAVTGACEPFGVGQGQGSPDLGLTGSPESNPIVVGEQDDITDTITNMGGGPATGVQFTDPAAGFTINSVTPSQGTCTHTATTVSCSLGTIPGGDSATVEILLTATSVGTITLHSSVSMNQPDPTPADNHTTTTIRVNPHLTPSADMAVSITPSAGRVSVGRTLLYTLLVTNHGPDAAHQVSVADHLPGNVELVSIRRGRQMQCQGRATITCSLGTLKRGATRRIGLLVRAQGPGLALDKAQVADTSPTDPNLRNNRDRAVVTLVAESLPTVGVIHLGASCHGESSTIHIRAVAFASAGIRKVAIAISGHGEGEGTASAPPPGKTVHRLSFGTTVKGSSLLAGRTYRVVATVTDALGRHSKSTAHFTVCNPPHRRGFTG